MSWRNLRLPFQVLSLLIITLGLAGGAYLLTGVLLDQGYVGDTNIIASRNNSVELIAPSPIPPKFSLINGVQISPEEYDEVMDRTPVAIVVNNHEQARPQSGLSYADVVMEVLAEGGITRYVAIYHNNYDVEKIGPIRSLRYYMIEFASGFSDALILHHGWAGFDNAPFERYNALTDARGAVSKFGIRNIHTAPSTYRDTAKASKSGYVHSLYTDFAKINSEIDRLSKSYNWELGSDGLEGLSFKSDEPLETRGDFQSVDIKFLSLSTSAYNSKFTYNKKNNNYPRFIGGAEDIDELTGKQLSPKNVVIEWHEYQDANDGHSRIVLDMLGEDKAVILRDGKVIQAKWEKECRTCRTKYIDTEGKEIPLNRGQIWVVNAVKVGDNLLSKVTIN